VSRAPWVLAIIAAATPAAAEPWHATVEAGAEIDSNVRRIEIRPGGAAPEAAPLVRAQGELSRRAARGPLRAVVRGLVGARTVVAGAVDGEDVLTAAIDAAAERDAGDRLAVIARATHYDVVPLGDVGASRAFASSGADLGLRLDGDAGRRATVTAGLRRLRYKPDVDFDWVGPVAAIAVGDELWRGADEASLELRGAYRVERRGYRGRAYADGCAPGEPRTAACVVPTDEARADLYHTVAVDLTYTGERVLAATYQLIGNDSSSFGSSFVRHRLTLAATTPAPGRLFVTASVTGQYDRYLDPLLVASDVAAQGFESIDDDNRSSVSVRVARALSACWQLEARAAFYADAFSADDRRFRRLLIYAGLTWERARDGE